MPNHACAENLVFVVGMYRSGTSLLNLLLNQHPDIALMYEADVMRPCPGISDRHLGSDWPQRLDFWNGALSRHGLAADSLPTNLSGRRDAALALYSAFAAKTGASIRGEKSPGYHDRLPQLADQFPGARFIVIWRDPADVLRSVHRAGDQSQFFAQTGWQHRLRRGFKLMRAGCAELTAEKQPLIELHFRELIADPKTMLRRLCQFLGVEYAAGMNTLEGADRSVVPKGQHHANLFREGVIPLVNVAAPQSVASAAPAAADQMTEENASDTFRRSGLSSAVDWCWDCYFRTRTTVVAFVYTIAPLPLLARYRRWKDRKAREAGTD